jgi:hypothetical protein
MARTEVLRVVHLQRCGGHVVRVRFNDGVEKRVNVLPLLDRGPYLELRDPVEFARVRLDQGWGILRWPGNRDLAPEALHDLPDEPEASTRRTPRARSRRPARR